MRRGGVELTTKGSYWVEVSPPFEGVVARHRNRRTCRNINCLAGVVKIKENKSMMFTVRKAVPEDAGAIIDFQLKMAWETEKTALDRDTVTKGVNAVFSDPGKGEYYVTEAGGKVVASLLITYEWSDWRNCNVWWFQSVFVVPEYRRQGIFRRMYGFIKEKAEKMDIAGLRLYVETGNIRAMRTYESLGMTSEHYNFYEWMRK